MKREKNGMNASKQYSLNLDCPYAFRTEHLYKCFPIGNGEKFYALSDVSIDIPKGKLTILKGRSGSGKTTLLNMLSALDEPSEGSVEFYGKKLSEMKLSGKEDLRRYEMGFVFQSIALIPVMSAYENVDFALRLAGYKEDRNKRIRQVMERVGLLKRMDHMVNQLSGGEQQRVAIARAVAHHPGVIFADEPTGAVDTVTVDLIFQLFHKLNRELGLTILIVTHDLGIAQRVDRTVMISDGKISTEKIRREGAGKGMDLSSVGGFTNVTAEDAHEEYSVLDKAHRVQLTDEMLEKAGIDTNKVKIEVIDGKVVISRQSDPEK